MQRDIMLAKGLKFALMNFWKSGFAAAGQAPDDETLFRMLDLAAERELREELGYTGPVALTFLFDAKIRNEIESENTRVYKIETEGPFVFQESEIDAIRFWSFEEIDRELASGGTAFTPNLCAELKTLGRGI